MATHGNDPLRPIGLLIEAANLAEELRQICRPVNDGGAADYVRLAGEDPMDYDADAKPVLAVPVSEIERLLERMVPVRIVTFDEVYRYVPGSTGAGKSNIFALLQKIAVMGRKSGLVDGINEPRAAKPDHT